MNSTEIEKIILSLLETFVTLGKVSLDLRKKGLIKETKSDNTPVTNGDIEVNKIITNKILKLTPNIKIVSEETSENKSDNSLKDFWLIDPIDGTSDYISGKDEFTINAALILDNKPAAGIINAPGKNRIFYSYGSSKSYELNNNNKIELKCKKRSLEHEINAVAYSRKANPVIESFYKKYKVTNYKNMRSSLKFCVIASGEFDFYAAEARAHEWDIAAGHAILEHAGGIVTDFDEREIIYGKKNFKNTSLILRREINL